MSHARPGEGQRFSKSLHGLRGVAACIVVLGHVANICMFYDRSFHVPPGLFNGPASVILFFVLSGLVLLPAARRAADNGHILLAFYIRRAFRLMPLMVVANVAAGLFVLCLHPHLPFQEPLTGPFGAKAFFEGFIGGSMKINGPSWSIFVEILASILMPLAAVLATGQLRIVWLVIIAATIFEPLQLPYAAQLYLLPFYAGALIGTLPPQTFSFHKAFAWAIVASLIVMFFLVRPAFHWLQPSADINADPRIIVAEVALIAPTICILHRVPNLNVLGGRVFQWLGDVSFGLYLLHFNVVTIMFNAVRFAGIHDGWLVFLLTAAATFAVTLPLAGVANKFIEIPGITLGRRLSDHLERPFKLSQT